MSHINVGPKYLDNSTGSRLLEGAKKAAIQAERPHYKGSEGNGAGFSVRNKTSPNNNWEYFVSPFPLSLPSYRYNMNSNNKRSSEVGRKYKAVSL